MPAFVGQHPGNHVQAPVVSAAAFRRQRLHGGHVMFDDLQVVKPSMVDAFTNSAFNELAASNPTAALPPEYPDDKAFFTVTFYFNETPPR